MHKWRRAIVIDFIIVEWFKIGPMIFQFKEKYFSIWIFVFLYVINTIFILIFWDYFQFDS